VSSPGPSIFVITVLAPIHDRFTESVETADLLAARDLLQQLT
jgi:hypothetical protein